jgi:hypothetical protein
MGVLTRYDQIEPIYLPQSVVKYISLHSVYTLTVWIYIWNSTRCNWLVRMMIILKCVTFRQIDCSYHMLICSGHYLERKGTYQILGSHSNYYEAV